MELEQKLKQLLEEEDVVLGEEMKYHTTFRVGGPAHFFVTPKTEEQLQSVLKLCKETDTPWFILGRGSNLLVSDRGFDGVVIHMQKHWNHYHTEENRIFAQAGAMMSAVSQEALRNGLTGFEFASGIPGTIGGGLRMNAGAYGGEMKQVVLSAKVMDSNGTVLELSKDELELGYRTSTIGRNGYIALSCVIELQPGDPDCIRSTMEEMNAKRRQKQPLEYGSAGSTFKRPDGYFAGKLIQDAGLKGFSIGDAQVSEKHAGFVINRGNAKAADIMKLCKEVSRRVHEQFGVNLEMEVRRLGKFEEEK
ncbi:MAG TPA: UDP-N-acetylmuramate dehydrogenase [Candidatus Fimimorpha faecalis]|uniref:UDP-N-acetylenolpyruvoylglucosamine reductase n=1 Tax=Candidatus Fimimorpha faecalis TaxID=2840824 RepID=A0A9D1JDU5_9FIRM|nr:UDP-N-acetylmuramate dehydrogenase [Candidatus Fimimorpha faecalis]